MTTAAARTARMAMTMRSSTRVNPLKFFFEKFWRVKARLKITGIKRIFIDLKIRRDIFIDYTMKN
jgi:hypothetical protein